MRWLLLLAVFVAGCGGEREKDLTVLKDEHTTFAILLPDGRQSPLGDARDPVGRRVIVIEPYATRVNGRGQGRYAYLDRATGMFTCYWPDVVRVTGDRVTCGGFSLWATR